MTPEVLDAIAAEVEQAVRVQTRRWPSLSAEDAEQESWLVCLAAAHAYQAGRPARPYFGGILRRAIPRYAMRMASPVHLPAGKEYQHQIAPVVPFMADVAPGKLARPLERRRGQSSDIHDAAPPRRGLEADLGGCMSVTAALDHADLAHPAIALIERLTEPQRLRPVRRVILDGLTPSEAAAEVGISPRTVGIQLACVRVQVLHDVVALDLLGSYGLGDETQDRVERTAGAPPSA